MEFEIELLVRAEPAQVFDTCALAKHQLAWMASLQSVEVDDSKPWGVGATFRQLHEESGIQHTIEGTLLDWQPPERVSTKLVHPDFVLFSETEFVEEPEGCRLRQRTRMELTSVALKLLKGAVKNAVSKRFEEDLARLKALVETQ